MKTSLFIILIVLFIGSCNIVKTNNTVISKDSTFAYQDKFIGIESINKTDFEKNQVFHYEKYISKSNLVKNQRDTLKFDIDSLHRIVFTDTISNTDESVIRKNEHVGNILDFYYVQVHFYETSTFWLINKTDGLKYELISEPYLSPNHKYILAIGASLEYAVMPTGLQVWLVNQRQLVKKIDLDLTPKGFQIEELRWITDDRIAVKIGFGTDVYAYGILTIK